MSPSKRDLLTLARLSCAPPLASSPGERVELRIYEGADPASAVRILDPPDPYITLVHVNRAPFFEIALPYVDTFFENGGRYDEPLASEVSAVSG